MTHKEETQENYDAELHKLFLEFTNAAKNPKQLSEYNEDKKRLATALRIVEACFIVKKIRFADVIESAKAELQGALPEHFKDLKTAYFALKADSRWTDEEIDLTDDVNVVLSFTL